MYVITRKKADKREFLDIDSGSGYPYWAGVPRRTYTSIDTATYEFSKLYEGLDYMNDHKNEAVICELGFIAVDMVEIKELQRKEALAKLTVAEIKLLGLE